MQGALGLYTLVRTIVYITAGAAAFLVMQPLFSFAALIISVAGPLLLVPVTLAIVIGVAVGGNDEETKKPRR